MDDLYYKRSWEAIALPRFDTLSCQQKKMGHKGGQR